MFTYISSAPDKCDHRLSFQKYELNEFPRQIVSLLAAPCSIRSREINARLQVSLAGDAITSRGFSGRSTSRRRCEMLWVERHEQTRRVLQRSLPSAARPSTSARCQVLADAPLPVSRLPPAFYRPVTRKKHYRLFIHSLFSAPIWQLYMREYVCASVDVARVRSSILRIYACYCCTAYAWTTAENFPGVDKASSRYSHIFHASTWTYFSLLLI